MQNRIGEEAYGIFFSLFSFCLLFQIILDPGILNYNSQNLSKDKSKITTDFGYVLGTKILLSFLFFAFIFVVSLIIEIPRQNLIYVLLIGIIVFLNSLQLYLRSHFSIIGQYKFEAFLSVFDKLLLIIILGYFLYVRNSIQLSDFIYGQIGSLIITCLLFLLILSRFFKLSLKISLSYSKKLIKKTGEYGLILLLMTAYTRMDGIMLERLLDDNAYSAGLYATGFRLLDAANMIGVLFATFMLPMFSKIIHEKKKLFDLLSDVSALLFVISTIVATASWFYNREILDAIYVHNTKMHYDVFKYLMISFWALTLSNLFGCIFLADGHLKKINWLFAFGILINISLNIFLIPKQLAMGAVIATLITQFTVFIGLFLLAYSKFKFEIKLARIGAYLFNFISIFLLFRLLSKLINLNWVIESLLISLLALLLSFLWGFLRLPKELFKFS